MITRRIKEQEFIFTDSVENIRDSRYYTWLVENNIDSIHKGVKWQYCRDFRYDKYKDTDKTIVTVDDYLTLIEIENKYENDFIRPGCERFWDKKFRKKFKDKIAERESKPDYFENKPYTEY